MLPIKVPTPNDLNIHLDVVIVRPGVPLLIRLDIMDREQRIAKNVEDKLESKLYQWIIPIVRRNGHMHITWTNYSTLFTEQELH